MPIDIDTFCSAVKQGNTKLVKELIYDYPSEIEQIINTCNSKSDYPFCLACSNGHLEIVKLLLKIKDIDVNISVSFILFVLLILIVCGYFQILDGY